MEAGGNYWVRQSGLLEKNILGLGDRPWVTIDTGETIDLEETRRPADGSSWIRNQRRQARARRAHCLIIRLIPHLQPRSLPGSSSSAGKFCVI